MTMSSKNRINADGFQCSLSDGTNSIEWDIAADSNPLLSHGAHTINKWTSQKIKAQGLQKDGVYEAATLTVTFLKSEFDKIEEWWKKGTMLTYTVSCNSTVGTETVSFTKTYSNCIVRASTTPTITPGKQDYVTFQIEISCLASPVGS